MLSGLNAICLAQTVKKFECEPYVGFTLPQGRYGDRSSVGLNLGVETRYNFSQLPLSAGINLNMRNAVREDKSAKNHSSSWTDYTSSLRTVSFSVTADWNFRQGKNVSPFAGLGLGVGSKTEVEDGTGKYSCSGNKGTVVAVPRIGVELWNHLRITLDAQFSQKYYNTFAIRVGYAFGGGRL